MIHCRRWRQKRYCFQLRIINTDARLNRLPILGAGNADGVRIKLCICVGVPRGQTCHRTRLPIHDPLKYDSVRIVINVYASRRE
jgi:hypothetical protein